MRCNNCGWDNPEINKKCEKCNATLGLTMSAIQSPHYTSTASTANKFSPQSTAVGMSPDDFYPELGASGSSDDIFSGVAYDIDSPDLMLTDDLSDDLVLATPADTESTVDLSSLEAFDIDSPENHISSTPASKFESNDFVPSSSPAGKSASGGFLANATIVGYAPDDFVPSASAGKNLPAGDFSAHATIVGHAPDDFVPTASDDKKAPVSNFMPNATIVGYASDDFLPDEKTVVETPKANIPSPAAANISKPTPPPAPAVISATVATSEPSQSAPDETSVTLSQQCVKCGYPIRPTDDECPMCGHPAMRVKPAKVERPDTKEPVRGEINMSVGAPAATVREPIGSRFDPPTERPAPPSESFSVSSRPAPVERPAAGREPVSVQKIEKPETKEPIRGEINMSVGAPPVREPAREPAREQKVERPAPPSESFSVSSRPAPKEPFKVGTYIQRNIVNESEDGTESRKLIGFLISYSNSPNGNFYPVYEGKNFIGRSALCHIHIQGDSSISERHLSILYRAVDRKIKFRDEQSSNGTYLNDQLLDDGDLKNFDKITIGSTQLIFMEIPLSLFE